MEGEGKTVAAGAVRVIPQLRLDLAIRLAVHQNIRLSSQGVIHFGKPRALLQQRVVPARSLLIQRLGGRHQQAMSQHSGADACLFRQTGFPKILHQQSSQASNLRRGHGGAGHQEILVSILHLTID